MSLMILLTLACSTQTTEAPAPAPAAGGASMDKAAILEKADAHDGETDHIVHECAGCALGMKGDPAHASQVDDYELHFCSEGCKAGFDKDPDAGIEKLGKLLSH